MNLKGKNKGNDKGTSKVKVSVKLPRYRAGEFLGLQAVKALRIFRQLAHEGVKVVSPTHRPASFPKL